MDTKRGDESVYFEIFIMCANTETTNNLRTHTQITPQQMIYKENPMWGKKSVRIVVGV